MLQYILYAAGSNSHHQLGHPSKDDLDSFTRLDLPPNATPLQLACGANHSLLLCHDDRMNRTRLLVAGSNQRNQLSALPSHPPLTSTFTPLPLSDLLPSSLSRFEGSHAPAAVAACWETSFILLRPSSASSSSSPSDVLLSLGANDWGERGVGSIGPLTAGTAATQISFDHLKQDEGEVVRVERLVAGPRHVLALLTFSKAHEGGKRHLLVGWGASRHGQLGPSASSSSPPKVTPRPEPVLLPPGYSGTDVADIAAGRDHSAVLLQARQEDARAGEARARLLLLGSNRQGQLGPLREEAPYPAFPTAASPEKGKSKPPARSSNLLSPPSLLDSASHPFSALTPSDISYSLCRIGCTWTTCFALLAPSPSTPLSPTEPSPLEVLLSFGSNAHGQLGAGSPASPSSATSSSASPAAGEANLVLLPPFSPAPPSPPSSYIPPASALSSSPLPHKRIRRFAFGSEHVLAVLSSRRPPDRPPPSSANSDNVVARGEEEGEEDREQEGGEVWAWGWNEHGNLGRAPSAVAGGEGEEAGDGLEDVFLPRRVWPPPVELAADREERGKGGKRRRRAVVDVWAGMATSWILVAEEDGVEGSVEVGEAGEGSGE
ncbi:hypothetical protein JCM8097_009427 [Rhodosporidiobolus ruineniae]